MELYHDFDVHVLDGTKGEKIASIGPSSVVEEEVHMEDKENVMVGAQQQQRSGGKFECGAQQTMGKGGCTGQRTVLADVTHRFVKEEEGAQVNRVEIASRGIEVRLGRSHGAPAAAVPPNVGKNSVSRMR